MPDKPDLKWLVIKDDNIPASVAEYVIGPRSYPYAFKPLAFGYYSKERVIGTLYVDEEPYANANADLAAQFGQGGQLVKVPRIAQKVYDAEREFELRITALTANPNSVTLAILGLQYTGTKRGAQVPPTPEWERARGHLYWLNVHGAVPANGQTTLSDDSPYSFMPLAFSYAATSPLARVRYTINQIPIMNQNADLVALYGTNGFVVPVPRDARQVYNGRVSFNAEVEDLSGAPNVVSISALGVQFSKRGR